MPTPRIGALIPVRLSSERLPGKALARIASRPMITHLLDRLFACNYLTPANTVVCTTEEPTDDALIPVVEGYGARVFRGSRDDIIERFHRACQTFAFDAVIQADGDDPCTDRFYADLCMERLLADDSLDIVVAEGLPLGLASKAIRASAIERVWTSRRTERNDTGFILYFTRTALCKKGVVRPVCDEHIHETARLTLDYPQDLDFFRALFRELYRPGEVFGIDQIVALLRTKPELLALNTSLEEQYWERTKKLARLEYELNGSTFEVGS